jgi:hypothetical protein
MPYHMALEQYRDLLRRLNWAQGLTVEDIRRQCPTCPSHLFQNIPPGEKFYSYEDFERRVRQVMGLPGEVTGR